MKKIAALALVALFAVAATSIAKEPLRGDADRFGADAPFALKSKVEGTLLEVKADGTLIVKGADGEKIEIAVSEKTRIRADQKSDFEGRSKLEVTDLEAGQIVEITHRAGAAVKVKVLDAA